MKNITTKQLVSYTIQVCLVILAAWWIGSSNGAKSFVGFIQTQEKSCDCEKSLDHLSSEQQQIEVRCFIAEFRSYQSALLDSIDNGRMSPQEYFIYLNYKDMLSNHPLAHCTYDGKFLLTQFHDPVVDGFHNEIRSGDMDRNEVSDAQCEVLDYCPSDTHAELPSWAEVRGPLFRFAKKLWWNYLFFGLLIGMRSINFTWRNPWEYRLFDIRSRKLFFLHLLIWPIRLWLWFKGNITLRQYGDSSGRILSEDEERLIKEYIESFGRKNLHQMLQARGFVIQRSLLRAMVIWIIALAITPQTSSARVISLDQASYAHCVHAPPDVSSLTLEDAHVSSLEVIIIIKRTLCSLIIHEQNYTRGQVVVLKYSEDIFSYIKGIILKRPWVPPQDMKIGIAI